MVQFSLLPQTFVVSCQNSFIVSLPVFLWQICVTAGVKSFGPDISNICVIYSSPIRCVKAFNVLMPQATIRAN